MPIVNVELICYHVCFPQCGVCTHQYSKCSSLSMLETGLGIPQCGHWNDELLDGLPRATAFAAARVGSVHACGMDLSQRSTDLSVVQTRCLSGQRANESII